MKIRTTSRKTYPFIRWAFILFLVLLAVYIPLKIYIARSENLENGRSEPVSLSIFLTNELSGYREPCG
ncbi:MAG: hypothetical protein KAX13_11095 [Candidatus Krumholzibacteria bacterium]|nr:hypothetical protein [Candidatus Krumholzibacteria bacterium]